MPPVPRVTFRRIDGPRTEVSVKLGAGPPEWSGPGATWDIVGRPLRKSITQYTGTEPRSIRIPLLFDGFENGTSIDNNVDRLERLCDVDVALGRPPRVLIVGPVRDWSAKFVVSEISYGDAVVLPSGFRTRLEATVTCLEFQDGGLIVRSVGKKAKQKAGDKGGKRRTTYTVKKGDTLGSIARKLLGNKNRARELQALNVARYPKLRDPRHLKRMAGKVISTPPHNR